MSEQLIKTIEQHLKLAPKIGYTILIDLQDGGEIYIDGRDQPPKVSGNDENFSEPDTTLRCDTALFEGIVNGTKDPNMAALTGKLKIEGSMGVALKLASLLED